jgi:antitoxin ParD1/3/4
MDTPTTVSIDLPEPLGGYVRERVSRGEYASQADDLRELVRRDREQHATRRIRELVDDGLASGAATPLTEAEIRGIRQRVAAADR